jgi:hypothetical protein
LTLVAGLVLLALMSIHIAWAVPWMKHESTSISAGDLLFAKGWRGQFFHSVPLDVPYDEIDLASLSKTMRFRSIQFSTLVLVIWGLVLVVSNIFAGNFYQRYDAIHIHETIFRGDDKSMKIETIRDLSDLRIKGYGPHVPERSTLIVALLRNSDDPEIRKEAAFGLCKIARTVRPQSKHQDWKEETRDYFKRDVAPVFRAAIRSRDAQPWMKDAAWLFLGSIRDPEFSTLVKEAQTSGDPRGEGRLSMLVALTREESLGLIPVLLAETKSDRSTVVRAIALWSLGNILESYTGPKTSTGPIDPAVTKTITILTELIKTEEAAILCASIQALGRAGDRDQADLLFKLMYKFDKKHSCEKQNIAPLDARSIDIMSPRPLHFITLEAIARIAGQNHDVIDRLQTMTSERKLFGEELIRQIQNVVTRAAQTTPR